MYKILIAEDDEAILNLVRVSLSGEGYACVCAEDGRRAADFLEREDFDLELLDYIRPMGIPVIFLTARGTVDERIRGLRLGADDYMTKPFQIGELSARVEAVLRRYGKGRHRLSFADVEIDLSSRTVKKKGETVELTVKEFDLLVELVQNKNVALYRERLYEKVWGETFLGDTRTLDSHIQRLRRKLGFEEKIRTVFRIGYRLEEEG